MLQALTQKVRLFSLRQIATHWWRGELANARRRLRQLTAAGLIARLTVAARPLPPIVRPLVVWKPDQVQPAFGELAQRLAGRWRRQPARATSVYVATARAAQHFGGHSRGSLQQPTQAGHDLGVAAIWLRILKEAPDWADNWQSEDQLPHACSGEKVPDALLVGDNAQVLWVVEFGGSYDSRRLREFHQHWAGQNLPYQIW